MLKGLINLFICCKPQNKPNKNQLETINYHDTEKNINEDIKKNLNKCLTDKSLTTKSTNFMNNCPTINSEKEKSPEAEIPKKKISSPYIDFPFEAKNINDEKNYVFKADKEEIKLDFGDINASKENKVKESLEHQELNNFCLIPGKKTENEIEQYENYSSDANIIETIKKNGCDLEKEEEAEIVTEVNKETDEFDKIIVPDKYIREDERNFLIWSKNGIIDFINRITNLDDYTEIKTKEIGLDIRIKKSGCELNKSIYLGKAVYKVAKKEFSEGITLEFLKDLMYVPELRLKWDEGFKEFVKLEGNDEVYAIKSWFKSPMFIISERDIVDKRIEFFKDNVYYNFSSSLDDKFIPEQKGVIRCKNYLNIFVAEQDEEFYYFTTVNQLDIKMSLPQSILNITLPSRLVSWYKTFVQVANKFFFEKK